jgi:hypothetical protein
MRLLSAHMRLLSAQVRCLAFLFFDVIADELRDTGVTVTVLCPGPATTGFASAANMEGSCLFRMTRPARSSDVARAIYEAMKRGAGVVVPGMKNKLMAQSAYLATPVGDGDCAEDEWLTLCVAPAILPVRRKARVSREMRHPPLPRHERRRPRRRQRRDLPPARRVRHAGEGTEPQTGGPRDEGGAVIRARKRRTPPNGRVHWRSIWRGRRDSNPRPRA